MVDTRNINNIYCYGGTSIGKEIARQTLKTQGCTIAPLFYIHINM